MKSILSLFSYLAVLSVFCLSTADSRVVLAADPANCKGAAQAQGPPERIGSATPQFSWWGVAGCTDYQLYVSTDVEIKYIAWVSADEAECNGGGTCVIAPDRVLVEGDYWWWVRGWQPGKGTSSWNSGSPFTVDLDICAKAPVPVAPVATLSSNTPVYQWQNAYGCEWYQLSAAGADGNVLSTWVTSTESGCEIDGICSYSPETALPVGGYYWWIRGWSRGTPIGRWTRATVFDIVE